jgi:hypothetical protein
MQEKSLGGQIGFRTAVSCKKTISAAGGLSRRRSLAGKCQSFGLHASEGQFHRCPVSRSIPVTNKAIQASRRRRICFMHPPCFPVRESIFTSSAYRATALDAACPQEAAGHKHRPAANPRPCPARRWARPRVRARSRLGGRGASGPWLQPVHLRQPLYPLGSPRTLRPPVRLCSRHESSLFDKKEPLCPPLSGQC